MKYEVGYCDNASLSDGPLKLIANGTEDALNDRHARGEVLDHIVVDRGNWLFVWRKRNWLERLLRL